MNNGLERHGKDEHHLKAGIMSPLAAGHGFLGPSLCHVLCFTLKAWKEETETGAEKHIAAGLAGNYVCTLKKSPETKKDGINGEMEGQKLLGRFSQFQITST